MTSIRNLPSCMLISAIILWLTGCGTVKPAPNSWSLPKKESSSSGMIIGRLNFPDNKSENPEHLVLNLQTVEFRNVAQAVHFGNAGEKHHIMANNYFVVPNLMPGTYRLISFRAGNLYHGLQDQDGFTYEVKAGQIKFIGSLDYLQYEQSVLQRVGKTLNYTVRKAQKPTELEMFRWLNTTSAGSGWEPIIKKRMLELGERP